MRGLPARYTIERVGAEDRAARYLGHTDDGRLVWMQGFIVANTYDTKQDAESFRRHRLGLGAAARVVRHIVH